MNFWNFISQHKVNTQQYLLNEYKVPSLTGCVTLVRFLNLCGPCFHHEHNKDSC